MCHGPNRNGTNSWLGEGPGQLLQQPGGTERQRQTHVTLGLCNEGIALIIQANTIDHEEETMMQESQIE